MAITLKAVGAARAFTAGRVQVAGSLRLLRTVKIMAAGNLKTVAAFVPPLSAVAVPDFASASAVGNRPVVVRSNSVTATPAGGSAPYSYAWSINSGDPSIAISAPQMASTYFSKTLINSEADAIAQCIVTDAYGATASCAVAVTLVQDTQQ